MVKVKFDHPNYTAFAMDSFSVEGNIFNIST